VTLVHWIIPIRVVDLLEIGLVTYVLYKLYQLMRGTLAVQIFLGIMAIYLVQVIVAALDLTMLRRFFSALSEVAVLAVIILFQPEIRRLLVMVAQTPFLRRFVTTPVREEMVSEVCAAVAEMSRLRIGALIAFERSTGLRHYIETGTILNAQVSRELLLTIFYDKNPLHDGAVIIRNQVIAAARCILPVSTSLKLSPHLGLRHRAAVGLTEQTDAFVVVVSEETGTISVAQQGELISNLTAAELRTYLLEALTARPSIEEETAEDFPS
jgi:diadenylate cyclase